MCDGIDTYSLIVAIVAAIPSFTKYEEHAYGVQAGILPRSYSTSADFLKSDTRSLSIVVITAALFLPRIVRFHTPRLVVLGIYNHDPHLFTIVQRDI